jgi:hypothetical protein
MKILGIHKTKINLVIDTVMFLLLMAIAGLGLLMKYLLIPRSERTGIFDNDVELYFFGLDRHDWGSIHLWLSFIFLFLILIHLILHWKMIVCLYRQLVPRRILRISLAVFVFVAGFCLLFFSLFIKPEERPFIRKHRHWNTSSQSLKGMPAERQSDVENKDAAEYSTYRMVQQRREATQMNRPEIIRVSNIMTLDEVSEKYNISAEKLASELDIPVSEMRQKIGVLRKEYGFLLSDVRKAVILLKEP